MATTVTFTGPVDEVLADMRGFLAAGAFTPAAEQQTMIVSVPADKPAGRGKKAAEAPKPETPTEAAPVEAAPVEAATSTETFVKAKTFTVEDCRAAMVAKAQAGKREEARLLVQSYGVKAVSEIPEEHYVDFMAKVNAL